MDLSYALDYPVISGISPRRVHLLVRIETWPEEGGKERKPLNLALAIDQSGSMGGEKLDAVKEATMALVRQLTPRDTFSLVTFADDAETVMPPGPVTDAESIRRAVGAIKAGGCTNLSAAWLTALAFAAERRSSENLSRVLLLTDGQANTGVADPTELEDIARQYREQGVATTTLGFGDDFNEKDLTGIAEAGGGHFFFIDSPEKAASCFLQEFGEVARIFGQNCRASLTPAEVVRSVELLGAADSWTTERTVGVSLGDVREQDRRQLLAVLSLPGGLPAGPLEVAVAHIQYDAVRGKVGRRQHVLSVKVQVAPEAAPEAAPARDVQRELIILEVDRRKQDALDKVDRGDLAGARNVLDGAAELLSQHLSLDPGAFAREHRNLNLLAEQVEREGASLRKRLSAQAHDARGQRGAYQAQPTADLQTFTLTPSSWEMLDDVAGVLGKTLGNHGYDADSIRKMEYALRELVENALEHGCKDLVSPRVEVELHLGRNYAKVVVRDNGPGFDFVETLAREEREAAEPPTGRRGRGLISVKRAVGSLAANAAGNEVTAGIRRLSARYSQSSNMLLTAEGVGEVAVVRIVGYLDSHSFQDAEQQLNDLRAGGQSRIIVDLSGCDYISSAGAGMFIGVSEMLREQHGRLILVSPSPAVREVLDLLGLDRLFTFADSVEEARRMLESGED